MVVILPLADPLPTTTSPLPFVFNAMFPFAASVIVMLEEFVPAFVSRTKSCAPELVIFPLADPLPITISPVPFGAKAILPSAASVIVMDPELVPAFVSSTRSCVPEDVTFAEADPLPKTISPVP